MRASLRSLLYKKKQRQTQKQLRKILQLRKKLLLLWRRNQQKHQQSRKSLMKHPLLKKNLLKLKRKRLLMLDYPVKFLVACTHTNQYPTQVFVLKLKTKTVNLFICISQNASHSGQAMSSPIHSYYHLKQPQLIL